MKISELFSHSLEAEISKYLFNYADNFMSYPDFIYGTIKGKSPAECFGIVYVGFQSHSRGDIKLWKTKIYSNPVLALEEMRNALKKAAPRFDITFQITNTEKMFDFPDELIKANSFHKAAI